MADQAQSTRQERGSVGLHVGTLGNLPVLGQSVAGIGPSIGAVSLIPLIFADAGFGSWLTVLIASIGVLAVGVCIARVAGSHFSAGALYNLVPQGLGKVAGFVTGWVTLLMMVCSGPFLFTGFAQNLAAFLTATHVANITSAGALYAIEIACLAMVTGTTLMDIKVGTRLFLIIEGVSMAAITVLLLVVLAKAPSLLDHKQFALHGATGHGVAVGIVIMILAYGGFEGATALGMEARQPRKALRIAVIGSVAAVAIFFMLNAYIQVAGYQGLAGSLASDSAPLSTLAGHDHVSWLGDTVLLGVTISFFAAANATLNYGPRVLFTMAHDGLVPVFAKSTNGRGAPKWAIASYVAAWFAVLTYVLASGSEGTAFGNLGNLAGYCGTLIYLLASAAAPVWAYRRGAGSWFIAACGLIGAGVMGMVFYYSLSPLPVGSARIFVFLFFAVVVLLAAAGLAVSRLRPAYLARVGSTEISGS